MVLIFPVLMQILLAGLIVFLTTAAVKCAGHVQTAGTVFCIQAIEKIVTLDRFFIFLAASLVLVATGSLSNISNHVILTLDILYIFYLMLLTVYHSFKEPHNLL